MSSRVVGGKSDPVLVKWHDCWILPSLMRQITEAGHRLEGIEQEDVLELLKLSLAGQDVYRLEQIPVRLLRALKLAPPRS